MVGWLTAALYAGSAVLGLVAAFLTWRNRPVGSFVLALAAAVELLLLVQLVTGVVLLARGEQEVSGVLFVAYLVGMVLLLPAAALWALAERGRWGMGVMAVASLTLLVLVGRLQQIWGGQGA